MGLKNLEKFKREDKALIDNLLNDISESYVINMVCVAGVNDKKLAKETLKKIKLSETNFDAGFFKKEKLKKLIQHPNLLSSTTFKIYQEGYFEKHNDDTEYFFFFVSHEIKQKDKYPYDYFNDKVKATYEAITPDNGFFGIIKNYGYE